jgi:hypothetical protein
MTSKNPVVDWLIDSDPSIRWQVLRDLLDAPQQVWSAERDKIEVEGWGARILSLQDPDGQWAGGSYIPKDFTKDERETVGFPWTATAHTLSLLREFGLNPHSETAMKTTKLVGQFCRWDEGNQLFWEGETEECINGGTVANGAYFGADVEPIVQRLLGDKQNDGGWNCERCNGSTVSSFATTMNVLEGLLEYERATGGTPQSVEARRAGEEYLLKRHLFRRLTTSQPADEKYLQFLHPDYWQYDVLRALDYFRSAGLLTNSKPDPRLEEAIDHVRSKRQSDGKWLLDWKMPGRIWFDVDDGPGKPSQWITLRAMRVLKWWDHEHA